MTKIDKNKSLPDLSYQFASIFEWGSLLILDLIGLYQVTRSDKYEIAEYIFEMHTIQNATHKI